MSKTRNAAVLWRAPNPAFQGTANQRPSVRWLVPSALRAAAAPELLRLGVAAMMSRCHGEMGVRLLIAALLLLLGSSATAGDPSRSKVAYVTLEGCPSAIPLQIPAAFTRPSGRKQERLREDVISELHANPHRRMRYSELFMVDWESQYGMPQISVASLGTLIRAQGRISEETWQDIKRGLLTSSEAQREELMRQYRATVDPGNPEELRSLRTKLGSLYEESPNTVVILGQHEFSIRGIPIRSLGAAKVIYTRQCVAYVEVAVDSMDPAALRSLNTFVGQIKAM